MNVYQWLKSFTRALDDYLKKYPERGKEAMRGLGRIFKRGSVYWIAYYHRGKEYRESSESESETQARKLLKRRHGEIHSGRFTPDEDRLTFHQLEEGLKDDYRVNGRRSLKTVEFYFPRLRGFFGFDRAIDITPDRVKAYQVKRLDEKASNATVNREVAILGRMLSLAFNAGKLSRKPRFQMLDENNVRQGFLEHGDFMKLLGQLPDRLKPVAEFLYLSGWRKGEAQKLEWRDVDLKGQVVRLRIENSKNKETRILPLTGRLLNLFQERQEERRLDCPYVFHHKGQKIGDFKKAWKTACKEASFRERWFTILEEQPLETCPEPESAKRWLWKSPATKPVACIDATELSINRPPGSYGETANAP